MSGQEARYGGRRRSANQTEQHVEEMVVGGVGGDSAVLGAACGGNDYCAVAQSHTSTLKLGLGGGTSVRRILFPRCVARICGVVREACRMGSILRYPRHRCLFQNLGRTFRV